MDGLSQRFAGTWGDGDIIYAYTHTGERVPEDDILLPQTFRGRSSHFGIRSLDWDPSNDQLWAIVNQGTFGLESRPKRIATIPLLGTKKVTWAAIPDQYVVAGETLDLSNFASNQDTILFGENHSPIPWLSLNSDGNLTIASSGVPSGITSLTTSLIAIGENKPAFTTFNLIVTGPHAPIWDTIPNLIREEMGTVDLSKYVTGQQTISVTAGYTLPFGLTLNPAGLLTIPREAVISDTTITIQVSATNAIGTTDTSFELTILNSVEEIRRYSYKNNDVIWRVSIDGQDISDDVLSVDNIQYKLDLVITGKFDISEATLQVSNHDKRYQDGSDFYGNSPYAAEVIVKVGYFVDGNHILRRVFSGIINTIQEDDEESLVTMVCVDKSATLRNTTIEDFGVEKKNILLDNGVQTYRGEYDLPQTLTPISDRSLSGVSAGMDLRMSRDRELALIGILDPYNAKSDSNKLETEGALLEKDPVVSFKSAYSYTTQTELLEKLLGHFNIANLSISQTVLKDQDNPQLFQSLGRVGFNSEISDIVRYPKDVIADTANNKLYILAGSAYTSYADYLWEFDRTTDKWTVIAIFSTTDETWQLASEDYNVFYVMATKKRRDINILPYGTYDAAEATVSDTSQVKILKVDISAGTITTFIDDSNTFEPQLALFYSVGFPRENASGIRYGKLPDTRQGFEMRNGKLYYRYVTGTATSFGIAEADSTGTTSAFLTANVTADTYGNNSSFCFCISNNNELFLAFSYSASATDLAIIRILKKGFAVGDIAEEVFTLSDPPNSPQYVLAGVLELFVYNDDLYVVAQHQHRDASERRIGLNNSIARLYHKNLTITDGPTVVKEYDYCQFAARSFVVHDNTIHFFEGSHYTYKFELREPLDVNAPRIPQPTTPLDMSQWGNQVGNLQSMVGTVITPIGKVWQTDLSRVNYHGIHGGTASPMISMNDELFIIPGFGDWDKIGQDFTSPINQVDNVNLITYGSKIDHRIARLLTNTKTGYTAIQEIAESANAFFGIDNNTFFFRTRREPRARLTRNLSINNKTSVMVDDTSLFSNSGFLLIDSEIIGYTSKTSNSFTDIKREIPPCIVSEHNKEAQVIGIKHIIYSDTTNSPIPRIISTDDKVNLYNFVNIHYADNQQTYTISDSDSIGKYGRRELDIQTLYQFTQSHQAAAIGQEYLETFKELQQRVEMDMLLSLYLNVGDIILVITPKGPLLLRIYELRHDFTSEQTFVSARTIQDVDIEVPDVINPGGVWGEYTWGTGLRGT